MLRARAVPRWFCSVHVLCKGTASARGLSTPARGRSVTCQLRPPTHSQLSRGMPARQIYLGRKRSTEACCARAPCRAGYGWYVPYVEKPHRREASLLRRAAVVRRASCGLQHTANFYVAHARAPLRWLSLVRRRRTRAVCTHAPCRAGCGRPMSYESTLSRREASLLQRAAVVRHASCSLQHTADFCVAHTRAPLRWLSLGVGAARGLAARARRAALA